MKKVQTLGLFTLAAIIFGCTPCQERQQTQNIQQTAQIQQQEEQVQTEQNDVERNIVSIENKKVKLETSMGDIVIELNAEKAPITVKNFLNYVNSGFYSGTIFHRVMKGFMIQGGGFTEDMNQKQTNPPIKIESTNGLSNDRGTIAMARTGIPDSATCQFFINHVDNAFLNYENSANPGYAVFGKVIEGMDVVDKIAAVKTTVRRGMEDVPVEPVVINSVEVISQ